MNFANKISLTILIVWCIVVVLIYLFYLDINSVQKLQLNSSAAYDSSSLIDGIILIAASNMGEDPIVDLAVSSIRKIGKFQGSIYVITNRPSCFSEVVKLYDVKILIATGINSIIDIKSIKTKLFEYVPDFVQTLLYLDVDIIVARSMNSFIRDLGILTHRSDYLRTQYTSNTSNVLLAAKADIGMFLDAGGHFFGMCSGCEKWHSGIIWIRRSRASSICMKAWDNVLRSGKFDTDQESIDEAERNGHCSTMIKLPFRHLLFAKDYLMMIFRSGQSFIHLTSAGRLESQGFFYRDIVVPRIRASLHPPLDLSMLSKKKDC